MEALLVRNCAEGIIRVDPLVADQKLGELVFLAVAIDGLLCARTCVRIALDWYVWYLISPRAFHPIMAEKSKWALFP